MTFGFTRLGYTPGLGQKGNEIIYAGAHLALKALRARNCRVVPGSRILSAHPWRIDRQTARPGMINLHIQLNQARNKRERKLKKGEPTSLACVLFSESLIDELWSGGRLNSHRDRELTRAICQGLHESMSDRETTPDGGARIRVVQLHGTFES